MLSHFILALEHAVDQLSMLWFCTCACCHVLCQRLLICHAPEHWARFLHHSTIWYCSVTMLLIGVRRVNMPPRCAWVPLMKASCGYGSVVGLCTVPALKWAITRSGKAGWSCHIREDALCLLRGRLGGIGVFLGCLGLFSFCFCVLSVPWVGFDFCFSRDICKNFASWFQLCVQHHNHIHPVIQTLPDHRLSGHVSQDHQLPDRQKAACATGESCALPQ